MCQNFEWVLCAVKGQLPGQRGAEMHFAKAPKHMNLGEYYHPEWSGEWWPEPHWENFALSDVFFAEIAILNAVCENSRDLFNVEVGETFECATSSHGFRVLRDTLLGQHAI